MASFLLSAFLCVAVLSCLTSAGQEFCGGPCRKGWVYHDGRCFHYVPKRLNWIDAEMHCVSLGGNLASEHSPSDHEFLKALQRHHGGKLPFWVGMSDVHKEGTWQWSDGTKHDFGLWCRGEPNSYGGNEDCVHSNWGGKDWNDASCGSRYPFVCSMRLPCGP